jgi:hypothetical protein
MSRAQTWTKWRSLGRRARQLWERASSPDEAPERIEYYTAIDHQEAIEAEGVVTRLEADAHQALSKPKKKRNGLEVKLESKRQHEAWDKARLDRAERQFVEFVKRFPHVPEQLVKLHAGRWKFAVTIVLALASEFALTYIGVSYIAPNISATAGLPPVITWALSNMALVATLGITWAAGLVTKSCGQEAAWGFNPLVRGPTERDQEDSPGGDGQPATPPAVVYSDRSQQSHRVAFGMLAAALLGLIVGLVLLRTPALALLGSLSGGSEIGGVAGSQASQKSSDGTLLVVGLLAVSTFPLFAAGWVSYLRESPLPNRLAALTDDVVAARKRLVKTMKTRGATEGDLANVGITMNTIIAERDANQILARLVPHLGHEIMVEALPELFGVVTTEPHELHWPADKLGSRYPSRDEVASEWFPVKPDPAVARPDSVKIAVERGEYVPPPETALTSNGDGPAETAWEGRS